MASSSSEPQIRFFNFLRGHPNRALLPTAELQEVLVQVAASGDDGDNRERLTTSLNYLANDAGDPDLLQEIMSFMDRHAQNDDLGGGGGGGGDDDDVESTTTNNNQFFLTHGVSHGIELLCATQTQPGDVVWMERPTYFLVASIFQSHHLHVQPLPMNFGGGGVIDINALETALEIKQEPPRMIYIIPTHQNPTGQTMPIETRRKLAELAQKHGILVVADEVYHLLDWRRGNDADVRRPARMAVVGSHVMAAAGQSSISGGGCVTVSSFTKIFCPGIRCGWIEGPPAVIDSLVNYGYIQSQGGGCTPFVGEIMRVALSRGIVDRVLGRLNADLRDRSETLCRIILEKEPRIKITTVPLGGYFVWIRFPEEAKSAKAFLDYCLAKGLRFLPGERCDPFGSNDCALHARLCFADMDLNDIGQGAELLVSLFQEYMTD